MRHLRSICVAGALLLLLTSCAAEQVHSRWAASPLAVNGQADDWRVASLVELEDQRISLAAQNDGDHLHLLYQVRDGRLARVMQTRGFQVWFCPDASGSHDVGIVVPASPPPSQTVWRAKDRPRRGADDRAGPSAQPPGGSPDAAAESSPEAPPPVRTVIPERITVLAGAKGSRLLKNRAAEDQGAALALMAYPGGLALELRLPYGKGDDGQWKLTPGYQDRIYAGIEFVGPLNKPEIARGYAAEPGGHGGRGGRGGGGRGGRGGPGGGGQGKMAPGSAPGMTLKAKEIWMRILLAEPK